MHFATLLFYAVASLSLGIIASSTWLAFALSVVPSAWSWVSSLIVALTIVAPVLFLVLALVTAIRGDRLPGGRAE